MMAKAAVKPKLRKNRPTTAPMNATGKKITTSDKVVAMTAKAISLVPSSAASRGGRFSSSIWRKMFSSTMMASSITIPVESDNASMVMLLRVNPM